MSVVNQISTITRHAADALPPRLFHLATAAAFRARREQRLLFIDDLVPRGGVAVDAGAWWGPWTYWLARRCNQVLAFEPNPYLATQLRRCVASHVTVEEVALSDHHGTFTLEMPTGRGPDALARLAHDENAETPTGFEALKVGLRTLDSYGLEQLDFLKVDVEGHEFPLLRGAEETLRRTLPVLLVEIEQRFLDHPIDDIFTWLEGLGYSGWIRRKGRWVPLTTFDVDRDQLRRADTPKSIEYVNNFVFVGGDRPPGDESRRTYDSEPMEPRPTRRELFRLAMRERQDPDPYYRKLAEVTIADLPVDVVGRRVLDLGCGHGWDSDALAAAGAEVIALDVEPELAGAARARGVPALAGDAQRLPFPDGVLDGVYCSNIVEHVPSVPLLIDEVARILRPGGWAWISWTNWWSPWGGHNLIPFHLLGTRLGPKVNERVRGRPVKNVPFEGLFPTYVGKTLQLVAHHPALELVDAHPRYYPSQRWLLRVPIARELLTWNCVLVLQRRPDPTGRSDQAERHQDGGRG